MLNFCEFRIMYQKKESYVIVFINLSFSWKGKINNNLIQPTERQFQKISTCDFISVALFLSIHSNKNMIFPNVKKKRLTCSLPKDKIQCVMSVSYFNATYFFNQMFCEVKKLVFFIRMKSEKYIKISFPSFYETHHGLVILFFSLTYCLM